jgi:23S rRNA (pseudouridine1915-N3)-methyltransferase
MKLSVLAIGKPKDKSILKGIDSYVKRTTPHLPISLDYLPDGRGLSPEKSTERESKAILRYLTPRDHVVLLDEKGSTMTSRTFSSYLFSRLKSAHGRLVFVIGGPFGFSEDVRKRSDEMLSLSPMTLTHEMCLLFFSEQIYRALMISKNTSYHHD